MYILGSSRNHIGEGNSLIGYLMIGSNYPDRALEIYDRLFAVIGGERSMETERMPNGAVST